MSASNLYLRYKGGVDPAGSDFVQMNRDLLKAQASIADSRLDLYVNSKSSDAAFVGKVSSIPSSIQAAEMEQFNRYGWIYPDEEVTTTYGLVFIVRPDLNILQPGIDNTITLNAQCMINDYMRYVALSDPTILLGLTQQKTIGNYSHHFVTFLLDRVEEYQLPSYDIKVNEITQPFTNFKTAYAGNANDSMSGSVAQITFRETSSLRVLKFFQTWLEYMNGIARGLFEPMPSYKRSKLAVGAQMMDYATSIYFIRVKPDMEIVYFHKQTGLFPKSVPHNVQAFNRGNQPENKVEIEFAGGYPEALCPATMAEFNFNSGITDITKVAGAYNLATNYGASSSNVLDALNFTGSTWGPPLVGAPFIVQTDPTDTGISKYYLEWTRS